MPLHRRTTGVSLVTIRGLARSSAYVNVAQLWQMGSRLILTPLVISSLGLEGYGAWTLVFSLCSYAVMVDAGAGWVYAKITADHDATGDYATLSAVISSGAVLVGTLCAAFCVALWTVRAPLLGSLGVPPRLIAAANSTLFVLSIVVVVEASAGCVLDVLAGLQRMDLQYRFILIGATIEFATTLALLRMHVGMVALPLGLLCGGVVSIGLGWIMCRRLRPMLHLSPLRADIEGIRRITQLGLRFQSILALNTVLAQGLRLMISSLYGLTALATYHLADRLLYVARTPGLAIISPLMPAFAHIESSGGARRWRRMFTYALTITAIASAMPLLFAAAFSGSILFAWTGQRFPDAVWIVWALAPAEFLTLVAGVGAARLRALGTTRLEVLTTLGGTIVALGGGALAQSFGGFAATIAVAAAGRGIAALALLDRFVVPSRLSRLSALRPVVVIPILFAPVCVLTAAGASLFGSAAAGTNRWTVLATLLPLAFTAAAGCGALAWFVALTARERRWILERSRRGSPAMSILPLEADP
jgi:O-antigen/teichoic acid export membrane protein